jgi:hypothetical protein
LTFLESVSKEDSFDTHHDHIQWKKMLGLLGLGITFEVVFGMKWNEIIYFRKCTTKTSNIW